MENRSKGVEIIPAIDPRPDAILTDAPGYFAEARVRARAKAMEEMASERERPITALETATQHEINGRIVFSVPSIIRGFKAKKR